MSNELTRYWGKVFKTESCWIWIASCSKSGYGTFIRDKSHDFIQVVASRYSYELHNGPIDKGMLVCHRCDNRKCVNPNHLFLGTHKDNTQDMVGKSRHYTPKLTLNKANEIRDKYKTSLYTQKELAKEFGISQSQVYLVTSGKQWKNE